MNNIKLGTSHEKSEQQYYSLQDITSLKNGYIMKAKVISYDSASRTGTCTLNGSTYNFKNATTQSYSNGNIIIVNSLVNDNYLVAHGVYASS